MSKLYTNINARLANRLKLIMLDVDGTLLESGRKVSGEVENALRLLETSGIVLGLVSGRTLGELEEMAIELEMKGPIIAENGAVAKLGAGRDLLDLGYSRKPAEEAFRKLQEVFPGKITGREDNEYRYKDIVILTDGISLDDIRKFTGTTQLLDSGYILHLMQEGISKGKTLQRLLDELMEDRYAREEVMVFGDSATDLSLFELLSNNVLVRNPNLPEGQPELMEKAATYISEKSFGEGFIEVALHITKLRETSNK
ncbi:MAG: HAD hydrolase family protein [Dehalococcoidales bacterium]|nr:HAD hydrolase family protein [Dehalococcoidales bacterium]